MPGIDESIGIMEIEMQERVAFVANLDATDRLLVQCLRVSLPEPSGDQLEAVANQCRSFHGWQELPDRAAYQGVAAWVHEVFLKLEIGLVPSTVIEGLRAIRVHQAAKLMVMNSQQEKLFSSLSDSGVDFIILKGPFLAEKVYPSSDLRSYTDIDLLVKEGSLDAAGKVLSGLEYRLVEEDRSGHFEKDKTQVHFYKPDALPIDLHWQVMNLPTHGASITIDEDEVWGSSVKARIGGSEVRTLSREDALLFQCAHLTAHHDFNRLLWFKDVQQVAHAFGDEIDWDLFIDRATRYHLKTFTYYALLMTADVCADSLAPARVLAALRPEYLTARLFERLIRKNNILEMQSLRRRPALEVWRAMRDERWERYGALLKRTFPGIDWYLECYPFLPKIGNQKLYYGIYPALMAVRVFKRPADLNLSDTQKRR